MNKEKQNKVHISVTLRPDVLAQGKAKASAVGMSLSSYIGLLIMGQGGVNAYRINTDPDRAGGGVG